MNLTDKEWNPIAQCIRKWEIDNRKPFGDIRDAINAVLAKRNVAQPVVDAKTVDGDMVTYYRERYQQVLDREKNLIMQLEHDRTLVAMCITAAKQVVNSRDWLTEGRGCYGWNDDKWHEEFAAAAKEFLEVIEPLEKVAADWKDCPTNADDISEARKGIGADAQPVDGEMVDQMLVCIYGPKCGVFDRELRRRMAEAARISLCRMRGPVTAGEYELWKKTPGVCQSIKAVIEYRIERILRPKRQTRVEEVTEIIDAYRGGVAKELAEKIIARLERYDENAD